jgi:hypothetical protein
MAYCAEDYCYDCKEETMHTNGKCGVCTERDQKSHEKKHFDELNKMTLEERVRRIEKWIYRQTYVDGTIYDR